jgi:RNA polymerase sigma factor (sigma-70 family)
MAGSRSEPLIQHLRRAVFHQDRAALTDGQLLEHFIRHRDAAAFEALLRRHGPMVLGVCRRVLGNVHDAEDAFQATFLVLARKAASVSPRELVGNWLYGVAHTTAIRARAATARRRNRERQVPTMPEPKAVRPDPWGDLLPVLDEELAGLPARYRMPIVLCDLEGRLRKEVARHLAIPEGTLSSRLTTGRRLLAKRLARHGLAVSGGALAAWLAQITASACVPAVVLSAMIKTVTLLAAGNAATAGMISAKVAALTEGVLKTMVLNKFKTVTMLLVVGSLVAVGGGVLAHHAAQAPQTKVEKGTDAGDRGHASPARKDDAGAAESEKNQAEGGAGDSADTTKQKVAELMRRFHEYYSEGKYQEAKKVAVQAFELDPDNPTVVAAVKIASIQLAQQEMAREADRRELLETIRRLGERIQQLEAEQQKLRTAVERLEMKLQHKEDGH